MKTSRAGFAALFFTDTLSELFRPLERFRLKCLGNRIRKPFRSQILERDRRGASASSRDHGAPKWLIAKKRNNDRRATERYTRCRCACSAMMNDARNVLEKPIVWTVTEHKDLIRF